MSRILQAGQTYIYTLTDLLTHEIRYVGKTNRPVMRLQEHIKKAKYNKTHKNHWILSLKKLGVKPVLEIKIWKGIIIASKELNINRCTISNVCNGRKKTAGEYVWKYTNK